MTANLVDTIWEAFYCAWMAGYESGSLGEYDWNDDLDSAIEAAFKSWLADPTTDLENPELRWGKTDEPVG